MIVFLNTVLFLLAIRAAIMMIAAVFGLSNAFPLIVILIALLVL